MKISIDIGEILTKAWKITWKYKVLWLFGILAGCATNGSNSNYSNSAGNRNTTSGNLPGTYNPFSQLQGAQVDEAVRTFLAQYGIFIALGILLLCVLWIGFFLLGLMGRNGLIKGVQKADGGAEKLGFAELWTESTPYLWRMFLLSVLVGLPFFLIAVVLVVILFVTVFGMIGARGSGGIALASLVGAMAIFLPAICCLGLLRIVVDMIVTQAQNAIVIENKGVLEGLTRGWNIFKDNFLTIIVMAIILGVVGFVFGMIIFLPVLVIVLPVITGLVMAGSNTAAMSQAVIGTTIFSALCCLAYVPVLLVLQGIERSYIQSAWTLTFLRLTAPVAPAAPAAAPESIAAA